MSYIDWEQSYSVSVKGMDDQHKRLFQLINDYYEAIAQKKTKEATATILQGLLDYTLYHFGDEEKLMQRNGYQGFDEQKAQHTYFISTIQDYQKRINEGKLLLSIEITQFLKDWLVKHIQAKDKQYGPFFNDKGIH